MKKCKLALKNLKLSQYMSEFQKHIFASCDRVSVPITNLFTPIKFGSMAKNVLLI